MIEIHLDAENTRGNVKQIQEVIGGEIEERWGEYTLNIDNEFAKGSLRSITFDWGVNLFEYDIIFYKEVMLILDAAEFNPIQFIYCLQGSCMHRFGFENDFNRIEQFQSVIITNKSEGFSHRYFPVNEKLEINLIQITRKKFLNKRLNNVSMLNKKLYEVFMDTDHENTFAYFGTYNLKIAQKINALRKIRQKGMIRILQIEGLVYQILSMHIQQYDRAVNNKKIPTTLLKHELKMARKLAKEIIKDPSKDYTLEELSKKAFLSQAKLQEAFKLMYGHTVTEYIRNVRLEAARDLISHSDLNISQIVYSIGFSSRSYFSKIFKDKYNISPSKYMKQLRASLIHHNNAKVENILESI